MTKSNKVSVALKPVFILLVILALLLLPAVAFAEAADNSSGSESTAPEATGQSSDGSSEFDSGDSSGQSSPNEPSAPGEPQNDPPADPAGDPPGESADGSDPDPTPQEDPDLSSDAPSEPADETSPSGGDDGGDSEAAPDDGSGTGNSYIAEITPDGVVVGDSGDYPDFPTNNTAADFTVTFTEVGDSELGSARVDIPSGFTGIDFNADWSANGIETNNGQQWEGKLDGQLVYLRAVNEASKLLKGDSVSVTFSATTPDTVGVYEFETRAWTGINDTVANFDTDGNNQMAAGYVDPVVIVGNPISSSTELANVSTGGYYVQTEDIDLNNDSWTPIGDNSDPFKGAYNGSGKTISNLSVNDNGGHTGLFGFVEDAHLKNINLVNVNIDDAGNTAIGGLVGFASGNYAIANCSVSGTGAINGESNVGGLIGSASSSGSVTGCSVSGVDINGSGNRIGGLVGDSLVPIVNSHAAVSVAGDDNVGGLVGHTTSNIEQSYATGDVTGVNQVGGLVGTHYGPIYNSYATGDATGDISVGGLVGSSYGPIYNSYANGDATGVDKVGGLVGLSRNDVTNSYSTGVVFGTDDNVGGLVGENESGIVANSYYNSDTSGQNDTDKGEPRTTAQMTGGVPSAAIFTGWDTAVWRFIDGEYPQLNAFLEPEQPGSGAGGGAGFGFSFDFGSLGFGFPPLSATGAPYSSLTATTMVFAAADGSAPAINAQFLANANSADLGALIALYAELLQQFEENGASMSDAEYASTAIELAIARAAILALDARLLQESGLGYIESAVIAAYNEAQAQLSAHGSYLSGEQREAANAALNAVAGAIRNFGIAL